MMQLTFVGFVRMVGKRNYKTMYMYINILDYGIHVVGIDPSKYKHIHVVVQQRICVQINN